METAHTAVKSRDIVFFINFAAWNSIITLYMLYIDTIFLQMNLPQGPDLIAWTCQQLVTDLSIFPPKRR